MKIQILLSEEEQYKRGRNIIGFSFRLNRRHSRKKQQKTDPKRDPNTPDFFVQMTDAQRHLFAHKLSELPEVGSEYAEIGESSEDFTKRLADMLFRAKKIQDVLSATGTTRLWF